MKTNIEDEEDSDEEDSEFDYDETALGNFKRLPRFDPITFSKNSNYGGKFA